MALRARAEARVREAEHTAADLEARAGIARQRIAILERELEEGAEARRQLAAAQQALQVCVSLEACCGMATTQAAPACVAALKVGAVGSVLGAAGEVAGCFPALCMHLIRSPP